MLSSDWLVDDWLISGSFIYSIWLLWSYLNPIVSQDDDSTDMFTEAIQNDKLHQMERNL